jgi:SSS family solute:Na+ symporter
MSLNLLDWFIIIIYLAAMIGLSFFLARGQKTARDYYLGGNKTAPLPIALSTMATQCSTNSLLGAPAFVAFAAGGGLIWLQYELAVPFAMIILMAVIFPVFRRLNLISLYAYLEKRFDRRTRTAISILFQFLRAFSTGVTVYGIGLVLMVCLDLPFWAAVLLLGGITVLYDFLCCNTFPTG